VEIYDRYDKRIVKKGQNGTNGTKIIYWLEVKLRNWLWSLLQQMQQSSFLVGFLKALVEGVKRNSSVVA
jgi:hypothetical protein